MNMREFFLGGEVNRAPRGGLRSGDVVAAYGTDGIYVIFVVYVIYVIYVTDRTDRTNGRMGRMGRQMFAYSLSYSYFLLTT